MFSILLTNVHPEITFKNCGIQRKSFAKKLQKIKFSVILIFFNKLEVKIIKVKCQFLPKNRDIFRLFFDTFEGTASGGKNNYKLSTQVSLFLV